MALTYGATTDRIAIGTTALPTAAGSLSMLFNPTWAQADNVAHALFDSNTSAGNFFHILKAADNSLYMGWGTAFNLYRVVVLTANYTINTGAWNHFAITWDDTANETKAYLNGTQIGSTFATLVTHTTTGTNTIGNRTAGVANEDLRGDVAEFAIWNVALDAAELSALNKAVSPLLIRPSGLHQYTQLIREANTIKGTVPTFTTVDPAPHPRMFYAHGAQRSFPDLLVVAVNFTGTITAVSTMTATLSSTPLLAGTVTAVSTFTATLTTPALMAGTVTAVSTMTADLIAPSLISGFTAAGALTMTGTLSSTPLLAGTTTAVGTMAATLSSTPLLAGTITSVSTFTATLTTPALLTGAMVATSTMAAEVSSEALLAGTVTAVSTFTATLSSPLSLGSATFTAVFTMTAQISTLLLLGQPTATRYTSGEYTARFSVVEYAAHSTNAEYAARYASGASDARYSGGEHGIRWSG